MKISRLFHWLYAFLMLLPVFFIGGRCLYTIFNQNAKDSYSGNVEYTETNATSLYNTNHLESNNDFIANNYYLLNFTSIIGNDSSFITLLNDVGENVLEFVSYSNNGYSYALDYANSKQYDFLLIYTNFNINNVILVGDSQFDDTSTEVRITHGTGVVNNYIIFKYLGVSNIEILENDFWTYFSEIPDNLNVWFITNDVIEVSTLDNAFEYSMNQLNEVPLFSWAKDSFLVVPFSYISGLFGIAISNPLNTLLSYWLSISIIWLTFDLVMYVPLLVHRWLDKGVVE